MINPASLPSGFHPFHAVSASSSRYVNADINTASNRIALSVAVHVTVLSQAIVFSHMWQAVAYGMNQSVLHAKTGTADNSILFMASFSRHKGALHDASHSDAGLYMEAHMLVYVVAIAILCLLTCTNLHVFLCNKLMRC